MEYLKIDCNQFDDEDLIEIVKGLNKLTHLILPDNHFTADGFREMAKIDNNIMFLDISSRGERTVMSGVSKAYQLYRIYPTSQLSELSKLSKLLYLDMSYINLDVKKKH